MPTGVLNFPKEREGTQEIAPSIQFRLRKRSSLTLKIRLVRI
jgi:hypothetical protein